MNTALQAMQLVAILRGIRPDEAVAIGTVLYEQGIRCIEVPLNSPEPFDSIGLLARSLPSDCLVGAGTVVSAPDVQRVKDAGGELVVTPNCEPEVIRAALGAGMQVTPGVATPTDAFAAVRAGATHLKLFPASTYGVGHLKALRAVLPASTRMLAVGGIAVEAIPEWLAAGAVGFGVASELYRPGDGAADVERKAGRICGALAAALRQRDGQHA